MCNPSTLLPRWQTEEELLRNSRIRPVHASERRKVRSDYPKVAL